MYEEEELSDEEIELLESICSKHDLPKDFTPVDDLLDIFDVDEE